MKKQNTQLVSIIISFLNEERFLAESVESVINQTHKDWELILVDDGSTDKSSEIAKDYADRYSGKIIYAEHEGHINKGLSASRNYGISLSHGELVAILDADDIWSPEKLDVQVGLMNENPKAAMLCEAAEYWYKWQNDEKQNVVIQIGAVQDKLFNPPQLAETLYPLSVGDAPTPSGVVIKKSVFDKHGGFEEHFTGKYQLYEDQAFLHKIYLNEPIYISSLCHHKYRQREGSIVQKVKKEGNYHTVRRYFLEWLEQYVLDNNIDNPKVNKLLKRALEPYHHPRLHFVKKIFSPLKTLI